MKARTCLLTASLAGLAIAAEVDARDVSNLDVCALVPDAVVAKALGGQVTQAGRRQDYGTTQGCEYGLGRAEGGGSGFEYVFVTLSPPEAFGSLKDALEGATSMGQKATGEAIPGLGDAAYAVNNQTERDATVHVLLRGDVAVEVKAGTLDHARKLAKDVLKRLEAQ